MTRALSQYFLSLRQNHPAWLLLASRTGPLVLASLKSLIDAHPSGIDFEDAIGHLASAFSDHANDPEFDIGEDHSLVARKELRQWIKKGLIVERGGELLSTDALQRSFLFLESLEDQGMTSTASRLGTVQRAIESLEAQLSDSQQGRSESLKARIADLEKELEAVQAGEFDVLDGQQAEEGIREVYQLAVSLRADFRRVEDSYRKADRDLRQKIISEQQNRGQIVDELLAGHEALVQTQEGQVFEGFYQQLVKSDELEQMKRCLRTILNNKNANRALQRKHQTDLRLLVSRLVQESERVIQARARSERDVRGFLKSGLVDEQLRVGALLQDIFQVALHVDWQSQKIRRSPSPLPPIATSIPNLPLIDRLLVKEVGADSPEDLDFSFAETDLTEMDEEFWQAYESLDREKLFESTIAHLKDLGKPFSIGDLAKALPPTHDLETLSYWLAMAREAGVEIADERETIDLHEDGDGWTRFYVPGVTVDYTLVENLKLDNLG